MVYATTALAWYMQGKKQYTHQAYEIASRGFRPEDLAGVQLGGRNFIVTGGNSGIGLECATALARMGATVYLLCRNERRGREAAESIKASTGNQNIHLCVVDMSSFDSIRAFVTDNFEGLAPIPIHGLINNAGGMLNNRECTPQGYDVNFATNVLGVFLLTELLIPALRRGAPSRVVTVSSGGMLTETLELGDFQERQDKKYDGTRAYARQKRMQVVLTHVWAEKYGASRVNFYSMHPGWADTPAVRSAMPGFYEKHKDVLRTAAEGADTAIWLAVSPAVNQFPNGNFFQDRDVVSEHVSNDTKFDYPVLSRQLYDALSRMAGLDPRITPERVSDLHRAMLSPDSPFKTRSQRLSSHKSSCPGEELMWWVVSTGLAANAEEAVKLCQQLGDEGKLVHVTYERSFEPKDSLLFRVVPPADDPREVVPVGWVHELVRVIDDGSQWTKHSTEKERNVQVYIKDAPDTKLKVIKVVAPMNVTHAAVEDLLHTRMTERHAEWNATYTHGYVISAADDDTNLQVWRYKTGAGVSPREFLVAHRRMRLDDGRLVFVEKSAHHPGVQDCGTEYVRCDLAYNVRLFSQNPSGGLICTHMNLTDLRGSLPDFLVNWANPSVSVDEIVRMREVLEDDTGAGRGARVAAM